MPTDDLMSLENESQDDRRDESGDRPQRGSGLSALAIFLSLGAFILSGWAWWEFRDVEMKPGAALQSRLDQLQQAQAAQAQDLSALEARVDALPEGESADAASELRAALDAQQARMSGLHQELEAQQSYARSLQQAIEAQQARLMAAETTLAAKALVRNDSPARLDLAGVGYLLRLAPERLTLYHDLKSADDALAQADAQLAAMDNPMYIGLRQHIADARRRLADTELPNAVELSARLDAVQDQLQGLEFGNQSGAPNAGAASADAPPAEQGWWARLKASLGGLVTVRRSTTDAETRLTFEDRDMLRQGLWMQIEAARLALMRHDQAAWTDALARAQGVLERWFDSTSAGYESVREELTALSGVSIEPDLPDISGPWAQLRLIREAQGASPAPSPAEPPAAAEGDRGNGDGAEASAPEESSDDAEEQPVSQDEGAGTET